MFPHIMTDSRVLGLSIADWLILIIGVVLAGLLALVI
jgi:hypothetical protein